jgi:hypothetical protein
VRFVIIIYLDKKLPFTSTLSWEIGICELEITKDKLTSRFINVKNDSIADSFSIIKNCKAIFNLGVGRDGKDERKTENNIKRAGTETTQTNKLDNVTIKSDDAMAKNLETTDQNNDYIGKPSQIDTATKKNDITSSKQSQFENQYIFEEEEKSHENQ